MNDKTLPAPTEGGRASAVSIREAGAGGMLLPQTLTDVVTFAQIMAKADIALPKFLRGNEGACLAVAMQAFRWEMDPFAVANKSYYVNDRVAYEAQLVAAVVHTRAPIAQRPNYEYFGEGQDRQCRVTCLMKDGSEKEYVSPRVRDILVKNSPLWKADLDQQLGYFSIRSFARRHCPEVILGVYTPDEVEVMRDVTPRPPNPTLRENLKAQQASEPVTGGFSAENVNAALDAEYEAVEPDPEPEATEVAQAPEEPPSAPQEPQEKGIRDMTRDERVAWTEVLRAKAMRVKTAAATMELWREVWDSHLDPLRAADPQLFDRLETWWNERMSRIRAAEQAT